MGSFGWVCSTHAARCNITYQKRVFHWPFAHLQYYTEFTHVSLNFARGITVVPQEIEDSDYAKGLGKDKVYFVRCARNGELKNKSAVAVVFTHSKERNPWKSSLCNNLLFACAIFLVFTLGVKQELFMAAKKRSILYTFWWRVSLRVPIKAKGQINKR